MSTSDQQVVEALRASLKERERLRQENQQLQSRAREPIAIVGMSCRYPGGVHNPDELWELLATGTDAVGGFPTDRGWDLERLYDPDPDTLGTSYTREGGFLYDAGEFDAGFFGIGVQEALTLDPQQRLLLEVAWEALEDAGIDPLTLRGSQTGVFAGAGDTHYGLRTPAALEGLRLTGTAVSVVSGRVAYTLGLEGPAVTVDTACSSSLVSLHMACTALRQGECSLALAGGVTVMATPSVFIELSRQRGLAPDGRCKAFSAAADGAGFAEGAGLVVLERLSEARARGHRVLALVRGSAVNQDGASNGLTAPNGPSQERVIRQALASAGLSTDEIDAVEAHGTGTTLGDPVEAHALLATYGQGRAERPLRVGSIKSNIGHTSMAAGVGGVIKMVLALRNEMLPPTLHVDEPSPHVDWSTGSIELLTQAQAWPRGERPRRAGVSSFGISGTNAHLVLEEAPERAGERAGGQVESTAPELGVLPWLVSAKSAAALRAQAARLHAFAEQHPEHEPLDVAFSLATRRTHFEHRAAVLGNSREELLAGLTALTRGEPRTGLVEGVLCPGTTAFMFTGQGAQRVGMGRELCEAFPVFDAALEELCEELDRNRETVVSGSGRPLKEILSGAEGSPEEALLDGTEIAQAGLFAIEVALFRLLAAFGVNPDFLIGHSIGELSAAHVAGVFSLADACRLVAARGRLMGALPTGGAMLAVEASEAEVRSSLEDFPAELALAAVNGPRSVVVSGDVDAVETWGERWQQEGRKTRRLRVSHAFHSAHMDPMLDEFRSVADSIAFAAPRIPIVSNVTGRIAAPEELTSGAYWARHVRETVRFADGIAALGAAGVTRFLELGPDGVLAAMARKCVNPGDEENERLFVAPLLRARRAETQAMIEALATAHAAGLGVDWSELFAGRGTREVELPTYAFQRERYWLQPPADAGDLRSVGLRAAEHPLLGAMVCVAGKREQWLFTGCVSIDSQPWVGDHVILDTVIVPGTAFLDLALTAGAEIGCEAVQELTFQAPLVLEDRGTFELQLLVDEADESGQRTFAIHSRPQHESVEDVELGEWTCHARGVLVPEHEAPGRDAVESLAAEAWPPEGAEPLDVEGLYDRIAGAGFEYGPAFSGIRAAWRRGGEIFTEVVLQPPHAEEARRFRIHPGLLDAALQGGMLTVDIDGTSQQAALLFGWSGVRHYASGSSSLRVRITDAEGSSRSVVALDETGAPVLSADAASYRPVNTQQLARVNRSADDSLFGLEWVRLAQRSQDTKQRIAALGGLDAVGVEERYADLAALSEAVQAGAPAPDVVLVAFPAAGEELTVDAARAQEGEPAGAAELARRVRITLADTLELLQSWVADERLAAAKLAFVSRGAVAPPAGAAPNLLEASCWGLVRSAQSEYPGRLLLIDTDSGEMPWPALMDALGSGEPQLAVRAGQLHAPRLVRAASGTPAASPPALGAGERPGQPPSEAGIVPFDPQGTILITGGTGALGAQLARHLAREHGARRLLLVSRSGPAADGAEGLAAELRELGCEVELVGCDVADREQLAGVLASIPPEHPLDAVIHAAGALDDGVIATLTGERLESVLRPKVDGALYLHELTRELALSDFILFSSFAALVGSPGQGNYAAANACLDALAQRRRAEGLVGRSLAWGPWIGDGGMVDALVTTDRTRIQRAGLAAFTVERGLAAFDRARVAPEPLLMPVELKIATLRSQARAGALPALLWGLVPQASQLAVAAGSSLARRLGELPEAEWDAAILELVRTQVAAVGGQEIRAIGPEQTFNDLDFDSLDAIELRNHLTQVTGLRLASTLIFDHPTPAAVARHLRARVQESLRGRSAPQRGARRRQRSEEPIAIVGMSCRLPGGVRSAGELWELVETGRDAVGEFPANRDWDLERLYDPDPANPGTCYARQAGFLYDLADFDAGFFGISPREALVMDPQQRLLLEIAWEACEDARIDPVSLRGSDTGVFVGAAISGYAMQVPPEFEGVRMIGTLSSVIAGRLAYMYGLEGPTFTVDTACSSSLVALHLARAALHRGECSMALAGGVNAMINPNVFVDFARQRVLAPDGRCKSYADRADGAAFSDGAGLLVLERLADAERLGHRVLAVLRGSATNQDGASNGLTAPNGPSQERVIGAALAEAGLTPADVDAVEGHGTGTVLGDPIEAQALLATYGQERDGDPLWLGSIKSNIGHAGCAAGVAGVMKMVMALRNELLPATLHVDAPSSHVDWEAGSVRLLTEARPWPRGERPRRAAVSSFGISGTNGHVILEEAPPSMRATEAQPVKAGAQSPDAPDVAVPLAISGRGTNGLNGQAQRLRELLLDSSDVDMRDVAFSLVDGRPTFEHRAVVVGRERDELVAGLDALTAGETLAHAFRGVARGGGAVFVFPGQGAQWEGMASQLLDSSPVFGESLGACSRALEELVGWRVEDVLRGAKGAPTLERVDVVQPVSFAVMVALADLWRSFGVRPAAVVGHSQGEIAAACVAGGLSLPDAARVVALRSRLLGEVLAGRGGMVSVALDRERVLERIERWDARLSLAAVNGPSAMVVSGESDALDELLGACEQDGVWARRVAVDYASHSAAVEELRDQLLEALSGLEPVAGQVPFFSTATGGFLDTARLDGEYWYRSLRERVRFEEATRALAPETCAFVEISPHPVLGVALGETLEDMGLDERVGILGSLQRGEGGFEQFQRSLAQAWVCGLPVDWRALFDGVPARRLDLPTYAFQRERYWLRSGGGASDVSSVGLGATGHSLLGAAVQVAGGEEWLFTGRVSLDSNTWLADHIVLGNAVVPGTALAELALAAGRAAGYEALEELTFEAPLVLTAGVATQLQVSIAAPGETGSCEVAVFSRPQQADAELDAGGEQWIRHAGGLLASRIDAETQLVTEELDGVWPPAGAEPVDVERIYERMADVGYEFGPAFRGLRAAWRSGRELFAEVSLDTQHAAEATSFAIHPALFDAAMHGMYELGLEEGSEPDVPMLPFAMTGVSLMREGAVKLRVRLARLDEHALSLAACDEDGAPVLGMHSLAFRPAQLSQLAGPQRKDEGALYRCRWVELDGAGEIVEQPRLVILGDVTAPGLEGDRYEDLAELARAVQDGAPAPDHVFVDAPAASNDEEGVLAESVHLCALRTLELLQAWLTQPGLEEAQLVLLTRDAVAVADGELPDLLAAPLWGLVRSAQFEHPGRVAVIDLDASRADADGPASAEGQQPAEIAWSALLGTEEPQIALRGGKAHIPRLEAIPAAADAAPAVDPEGTVLIVGGTGVLGALVARQLVAQRGARHLVLASRSGLEAEGAGELLAELQALGCEVRVAQCDAADREQLAALIDSIQGVHPLRMVVHAAGALQDGLLQSLTAQQLRCAMQPKVDAALNLHELTKQIELVELVLFSSFAALVGSPGQANYAAANAFLDALAQRRRSEGLPAKSIAWGLWEQVTGMTAALGNAERERMARLGIGALSSQKGLELLDAGRPGEDALLLAARLDLGALRKQARMGVLPALLSGLVPAQAQRGRGGGRSLAQRLAAVPESEWDAVVLELVRTHAAAVLGHDSGALVDPERAFKDLGFDSLGAVNLRNRLAQATGLRLPATLVFDHPNCTAVAQFLRSRVEARGGVQAVRRTTAARGLSSEEPIALVGMACRYPGGASSPQRLWELLVEGRDAISAFPTNRGWDLDSLFDPDPDHPRTSYAREGGFLHDGGEFDADFFGISPREALAMDPQQRLMLETVWEAFEDAGIDPGTLRGSPTGVFAGVTPSGYAMRMSEKFEGLQLTGSALSVVSGRVAYTFGLEGPAMSVDTACSSSLVALHLACKSLRNGECTLALAGGASLMATPGMFTEFSRQRGLAPDGRCKSFAAAADGVGWSEGIGTVVLERLSDAQRLGHRVLALVRGSAINQDGASNGLAAPNGPSQERVIRQALEDAGLAPGDIDAIEAHGTGTRLGDPIEAQALLATYGQERADDPVRVGSIKSNIGHALAASGMAGVLKMTLALRHGLLPATLHVDAPSPEVDWSAGAVRLLTEAEPWLEGERPRRAGISSFGISGTNAHVILEEAPRAAAESSTPDLAPQAPALEVLPWLVSARGEVALRAQAERLRTHLKAHPEIEPRDAARSLATTRAQHEWRAAIVAGDRDGLLAGLAALVSGEPAGSVVEGRVAVGKTAFVFTGQGAQHAGMGAELHEALPLFRSAFDEICAELDAHLGRSLQDVVWAAEGSPQAALLDETELTQAALFAFEVALARQLEAWGMKPDLLIGHSIGEVVAAHLAGVLSLADACTLVAARGRLMGALPAGGAMLAVQASEQEVARDLEGFASRLTIAAVNGPRAVVVSGEATAVEELADVWRERGRKITRLRVSHAFHSHLMDPMLVEFGKAVGSLTLAAPRIPVISNLTGEVAADEALCTPEYWMRHVRETVRFADGVGALERAGARRFIEVGPGGALCALARECLSPGAQERALVVAAQRAAGRTRHPEVETLVKALASAHTAGVSVDWPAFFGGGRAQRVDLPSYAFQRESYWLTDHDAGADVGAAGLRSARHPLLGAAVELAGGEEWLLTGRVSPATHRWIADHAVLDTVLLPGTAFLELLLAAGRRAGAETIEELTLEAPLVLAQDGAALLQVTLAEPDADGRRAVAVYSRAERAGEDLDADQGPWTRHAGGALVPGVADVDPAIELLRAEQWPPVGAEPVDTAYLYDRLAEIGFGYGAAFQAARRAWRRGEELFVEAALSEQQAAEAERFQIHPALFDAALHPMFVEGGAQSAGLPFSWSDVRLYRDGACSLRARVVMSGAATLQIAALDELGAPLLSVGSVLGRPVDSGQLASAHASERGESLYGVEWRELTDLPDASERERLALLGDLRLEDVEAERYENLKALCAAIEAGAPAPGVVFACAPTPHAHEELGEAAREVTARTLELLKEFLAAEALADARLVLLTRRGVPVQEGEEPDLALAPLSGLIASAQPEHPGRFLLVDLDDDAKAPWAELLEADEPLLALRGGGVFAPRMVAAATVEEAVPWAFDPEGTVLITGGTGGLGALVARHLASAHGARRLLLVSRRGSAAPGADELVRELEELGAQASAVACDVADRRQLSALLESIPGKQPLTAVIHAAGVLDDGLLGSLEAEHVERVMRPKVDAALHLHELTEGMELAAFVLFSSVTATIGSPGQGNYAAANAFLDALARHRRAHGLPASALAWGLWADGAGMAGAIGEAGVARAGRLGIEAISSEQGLRLLDAALAVGLPLLAPVALDPGVLRAQARMGVLPAPLRGLIRAPIRRGRDVAGSLARRLAGIPETDREEAVLDLVRAQVAAVLGHDSTRSFEVERAFSDLGFDSLSAVELRNRLHHATGVRLPATLVFDHPTPAAVAKFLLDKVEGAQRRTAVVAHRSPNANDPVAIVGMSCRYPGGARNPEELWQLLADGVDAISEFPRNRGWDVERLYDPDPDNPGTSYTREGGFVHDAADFDARFFGMGAREALATDPQQRQLLEAAWEAFEDARIDPLSLRGSETGVFCGVMYQDYGILLDASARRGELEGYVSVGSASSVVSGRLAYVFGLEGPAVTIDTACSSSLVALHLASQSLRQGECSMALVGGVTVLSNPGVFIDFSQQRGLAADGRCKSYASAADGVGWAEGAGLLVLERLSDARRRGHRVLAVVRGSAVNQDGASNGLTAPNGPSQERVIRQALANAGLSTDEVDAVEGHGTGTVLGDPIEAQALLATYGHERDGDPLWLGSVKSNIGHTQAAAGVAGVMKMVMAMRNELLPRTLHVDEPSSHVDWSQGAVSLLREPVPWPAGGRPRRAAVSSFGVSGTNAHVIIEEPPLDARPASMVGSGASTVPDRAAAGEATGMTVAVGADVGGGGSSGRVVPLVLSARGVDGLCGQAGRLGRFLAEAPDAGLLDVGFSLLESRAVLDDRGVVLATDREGSIRGLDALAAGGAGEGVVRGVARGGRPVFVFPGQGAQWEGMAVDLLDTSAAFRDSLRACERAFEGLVEWRVEDVLRGADGAPGLERVDVVQPVSFAVMVALAGLWRSFGVEPGVVVGHSQGEIAAACVAGGLSLHDAARVVVLRSRLLGEVLAGHGGMVSVALPAEQVERRLAQWGERLSVAAVNGPSAVVISGESAALDEFLRACEAEEVWARKVAVDYASHSAAVEGLRDRLVEALEGLEPTSGDVPFFSTATGGLVDTAQLDAEYWYRSLREQVKFAQAVRELATDANAFIEVSPHPVLRVALEETLEDVGAAERIAVLGSLQRDEGGLDRFLRSLAEAWVVGAPVDWRRFFAGSGAQTVDLPTYAFQRRRYWVESQGGVGDVAAAGLAATGHPLLGAGVRVAGRDEWLFTRRLGLATHPWIRDHAVLGTVLLPGTGFVELALAAARQVGCDVVEELTLEAPLVLGEDSVHLQVLIGEADEEGQRQMAVYSCQAESLEHGEEASWVRHASGRLAPAAEGVDASLERAVAEAWPPAGGEPVEVDFLYDVLSEAGLEYGPMFQGVRTAWRRDGEIFAEVALDEQYAGAEQPFGVHPALFDAALHAGFALRDDAPEPSGLQLPFSFNGVRLHGEGRPALRVLVTPGGENEIGLVALDGSGAPVLSVRSLVTRPVDPNLLAGARLAGSDSLFAVGWAELAAPAIEGPQPRFALLGDLAVEGLDAERYANVEALGAALADGATAPDVVLVAVPAVAAAEEQVPQAARAATGAALELLKAWVADEQLARTRLVLVSAGAIAVEDGELPSLQTAPVWGLLRSAQSEHPDRFSLVDLDPDTSSAAVSWAELTALEEPQLAVRAGRLLAPRLIRVPPPEEAPAASLDAEGTILITGGTSGLGALFARHLARAHGVRHLLLTSRSGPAADGAGELVEELAGLGCQARVVACDVSDRAQCAELIESIPAALPLRGVVHSAGVLEDGLLGAMSAEQLERVMRPKVDGAFNLHELTAHLELSEFVLFSSSAGLMGSPGQANYAAGNAFLDALAQYRRGQGLAGRSLAWGMWGQHGGMTSALGEAGVARLARLGVLPLEAERGLELFDLTRALDQALLAPVALDMRVLRSLARVGMLPALLHGVVRVPARRADGDSLARRLASVPQAEWESTVLELVRTEVAAVLGREVREVDSEATFTDLGFDSLGAVELRNRLNQLTGLRLPATLVFDYPTPARVAAHVLEEAVRNGAKPEALLDGDIDRLQARLATLGSEESERKRIAARLRVVLEELQAPASADGVAVAERIESASAEEVLEFIDRELETY